MENALVAFGRWVLVDVFDNDARAALEDRGTNTVRRTLTARAGGPTLRLSRRPHVALTIAAPDRRVGDAVWRALEPARQELLLPLGDDAEMCEAAQRVRAMKLSQRTTRATTAPSSRVLTLRAATTTSATSTAEPFAARSRSVRSTRAPALRASPLCSRSR